MGAAPTELADMPFIKAALPTPQSMRCAGFPLRAGSSGSTLQAARSSHPILARRGLTTNANAPLQHRWSASRLLLLFGGLGSTVWIATQASKPAIKLEASGSSKYTKDQVGIITILGGPLSGKSTQTANITKRFNLDTVDGSFEAIQMEVAKRLKSSSPEGKKVYLVSENFPKDLAKLDEFQSSVVSVLLYIYIDVEPEKAAQRLKGSDDTFKQRWADFNKQAEPLVKKFRFQGNILEVGLRADCPVRTRQPAHSTSCPLTATDHRRM